MARTSLSCKTIGKISIVSFETSMGHVKVQTIQLKCNKLGPESTLYDFKITFTKAIEAENQMY